MQFTTFDLKTTKKVKSHYQNIETSQKKLSQQQAVLASFSLQLPAQVTVEVASVPGPWKWPHSLLCWNAVSLLLWGRVGLP